MKFKNKFKKKYKIIWETLYSKPDVSSNPTALKALRVQRLCERLKQRQMLKVKSLQTGEEGEKPCWQELLQTFWYYSADHLRIRTGETNGYL
jgi:hypothetical protein